MYAAHQAEREDLKKRSADLFSRSAAFRDRQRSMCPPGDVTPHPRRSGPPPSNLGLSPRNRLGDSRGRASHTFPRRTAYHDVLYGDDRIVLVVIRKLNRFWEQKHKRHDTTFTESGWRHRTLSKYNGQCTLRSPRIQVLDARKHPTPKACQFGCACPVGHMFSFQGRVS